MLTKYRRVLGAAAVGSLAVQACAVLPNAAGGTGGIPQAGDAYFTAGEEALRQKLLQQPNMAEAKNVILFVGDGMSITTIAAARIYAGQKSGLDGVSYKLAMEQLPYSALSRTYSDDSQVADSAPSATAMTTGAKTIDNVVGLNRNVVVGDCASARGNELMTIFEMAEMAGLSTGVVSTARITHATPASAYAHTPHRNWEDDNDMPAAAKTQGCVDIALQLVEWDYGDGFEVVLGGGRRNFLSAELSDIEYPESSGSRGDGRNLITEWLTRNDGAAYVWNKAEFDAIDAASTARLLGLFEPDMMNYESDRMADAAGEPSLAEMTGKAIEFLSKNENGYVLMVEGARIDHAHHAGNAARALEDTDAFDAAIATALEMTNTAETLIVVTADHSHTLSFGGYPARNNPILGLAADASGEPFLAQDGKPFATLGYANGPGATEMPRADLTDVNTLDIDFKQQAPVPLNAATHSGDDVAIFASGPYAHLFQGVVDQHFIYHVMVYASRIPGKARVK